VKSKAITIVAATIALFVSSSQAHALQYITGHVTLLEPTYLPDMISFQMDAGNAACPAGQFVFWRGGATEAVYTTLLSALLANKTINFVIEDDDTSCTGRFVHISR